MSLPLDNATGSRHTLVRCLVGNIQALRLDNELVGIVGVPNARSQGHRRPPSALVDAAGYAAPSVG